MSLNKEPAKEQSHKEKDGKKANHKHRHSHNKPAAAAAHKKPAKKEN